MIVTVKGVVANDGALNGRTVMLNAWLALGLTSLLAVIMPVNVPACIVVPEMTPLGLRLSPDGRLPEETLKVGTG
jgi:hypothetical protein